MRDLASSGFTAGAQSSGRAWPRATRACFSGRGAVRRAASWICGALSGSGESLSQGGPARPARGVVPLQPLHEEPDRPVLVHDVVAEARKPLGVVAGATHETLRCDPGGLWLKANLCDCMAGPDS